LDRLTNLDSLVS